MPAEHDNSPGRDGSPGHGGSLGDDGSPGRDGNLGDDGSLRHDGSPGHGGSPAHGDSPSGGSPGHDRSPAHDGREVYDGMDALMVAITGAALPEPARGDGAFMAGHRAAVADVALLREQLGIIADALTEPAGRPAHEPAHEPASAPREARRVRPSRPLPRPRRRLLPVALGAVGVAVAGAMVTGLGWLLVQAGGGADDSGATAASDSKSEAKGEATSNSALGNPGYLACARLVVEGDVTKVVRDSGTGEDSVTLHVTRFYKPEQGKDEVGFVLDSGTDPLLSEGDHVLVGISHGSASPDVWIVGDREIARERDAVVRALPESRGTPCE
ncbi:hypothetical protein ACFYWX_08110 [Streptomyces sp. NPDC002888]|uniref:hypothetical protein n=1 Tax=Streptomyces sp. NPDC002888 TaxID=3364668 RepID=UPI003684E164